MLIKGIDVTETYSLVYIVTTFYLKIIWVRVRISAFQKKSGKTRPKIVLQYNSLHWITRLITRRERFKGFENNIIKCAMLIMLTLECTSQESRLLRASKKESMAKILPSPGVGGD